MSAWRRKPEGFEWHKYIRTTIKVRREARRQKVVEARQAAGEQMGAAGAALVAGSRAAGSAAGAGARAGAGAMTLAAQGFWAILVYWMGVLIRTILNAVSRPHVGGPLGLIGAAVIGAAVGRWRIVGLDREALITLIAGGILFASLLPMLAGARGWQMPEISGFVPRIAAAAVLILLAAGGAAWATSAGSLGSLASVANLTSLFGGTPPVKGRAQAMGPDLLRVGGATVKLTGIEAPEREQRCGTERRSWRCVAAAESALSRIVDGRTVSCAVGSPAEDRIRTGSCTVGDKDVAGELVRQGHVFSDGTILARYGGEEREARDAKLGLWRSDAERPAVFRAKVWEEAKKRSPDGCPIKGQVARGSRIYVLPWAPDYDRIRVQRARGERWFCSEQEAVSAGFRAAQRG
jgi:endonuclease YncB( thermonuclease family)